VLVPTCCARLYSHCVCSGDSLQMPCACGVQPVTIGSSSCTCMHILIPPICRVWFFVCALTICCTLHADSTQRPHAASMWLARLIQHAHQAVAAAGPAAMLLGQSWLQAVLRPQCCCKPCGKLLLALPSLQLPQPSCVTVCGWGCAQLAASCWPAVVCGKLLPAGPVHSNRA
jgi:hypothetical protein